MKKSSFVALLLGTVSGVLFALGMCMALISEWNSFRPGVVLSGAGLLLGTLALYTGTLRWGILLHLCNNLIAWGAAYHPSAVTSVILPAVLVLLGLLSIPALRRMPGRVFPQGSPRAAVTLSLLLSLILLLGSAFLPAL